MPKPKTMPSAKYLRECLDYNPASGELRWKERPREHFPLTRIWQRWNTIQAGTVAGARVGKKSCRIGLAGSRTTYSTHRVIWKWMTGKEPPTTVDHKDHNFCNNRWDNLRLATINEQNQNRRRKSSAKNPYKGVQQSSKGSWRAKIMANGVRHCLGSFPTAEAAAAAYRAAATKLHKEFCATFT